MLFCSADPVIWNKNVQGGPNHFAKPIQSVANDIRYLRLHHAGDYVILPITKDRLATASARGGFGWEGRCPEHSAAWHLGIYADEMRPVHRGHNVIHATSGWGFGHRHDANDGQGYSWDGDNIEAAVLIAVKAGALTAAEEAKVLQRIMRTKPINPARLSRTCARPPKPTVGSGTRSTWPRMLANRSGCRYDQRQTAQRTATCLWTMCLSRPTLLRPRNRRMWLQSKISPGQAGQRPRCKADRQPIRLRGCWGRPPNVSGRAGAGRGSCSRPMSLPACVSHLKVRTPYSTERKTAGINPGGSMWTAVPAVPCAQLS